LSDDDMLMEGSISKIMGILNHDIDVLFFTVKDRENIEFQNWTSDLIELYIFGKNFFINIVIGLKNILQTSNLNLNIP
jgi:hypothetical protein